MALSPHKSLAIVQLLRPLNVVLSLAGVGVGALLAAGPAALNLDNRVAVLLAMVSAASIGAAANALNDALDVSIDLVNRPGRPIPSGRATPAAAKITWLVFSVLGVGLSVFLSPLHVAIATFSAVAVFLYSSHLKRLGIAGNVTVSLVVATALIYGGLATGTAGASWAGFVAAFLLTMAREITKDVEDVDGDRGSDVRSLPIVFGRRAARFTIGCFVGVTVLLAPLPYTNLGFSGWYLLVVAVACLILLRVLSILLRPEDLDSDYTRASALLKSSMAVGMLALALGTL